ncbi:aldehyde dehydrogenase family protein [Kistimonas scapharcae]|uniref:Aldehyde dehydrogenase family protein n=1 Tax=Kistimonas scapharcae TaxID=1036133 RepID=A0ABP8V761_9GAMM
MQDKLYINGEWVTPDLGQTFPVFDPASEAQVHAAPAGSEEDINHAVSAARQAFEGSWRQTTGKDRAALLSAMADELEHRLEELARLEVLDNGKPLPEAVWDIEDTVGVFRYYAELAVGLDDQRTTEVALPDPRFRSVVRREPVGVAGHIIPWNFPLLMAAWKVAPAIAAGATMVLKPSELTPLTALELGKVADAVELPPGVLNIVTGLGKTAGAPLSQHPGVDKIAFTGSVPTGAGIMSACSRSIKNVSLELGGKSAFIIYDDADIDAAVEWILFGIFWNQGEVCSATSRLIIHEAIADRVHDRLKEEARKITIGHGMDEGVLLGPLVSVGQYEKVLNYIEHGKRSGLSLLTGGQRPEHLEKGYFLEPTIFTDVPETSSLWQEEIFGPVLCTRTFRDEREAIRLANNTPYGLAAAVMSQDPERCTRTANALRAGIVWVNCSQPTFTEAPWGGMGHSGIGRELGQWGLNNYLETKQITEYTSRKPWGWYLK